MSSSARVLVSQSTDPLFNLAMEELIYREIADAPVLILWQNRDSVIIGRNQNPWLECRVSEILADDVVLARRQSGGGTVFHDLGNTNFTFLAPHSQYRQDQNFEVIVDALAHLGVSAHRTARNDIFVGDRKVSGNAFKHTKERSLHHGTLLHSADLTRLQRYLNPTARRLTARGTKSVRSEVANLQDLSPDINHHALIEAICATYGRFLGSGVSVERIGDADLSAIPGLREYYEHIASWDWTFGRTPEFSLDLATRFPWGRVELTISVNKGRVHDVQVSGVAESATSALIGCRFVPRELATALRGLPGERVSMIADWLEEEGVL